MSHAKTSQQPSRQQCVTGTVEHCHTAVSVLEGGQLAFTLVLILRQPDTAAPRIRCCRPYGTGTAAGVAADSAQRRLRPGVEASAYGRALVIDGPQGRALKLLDVDFIRGGELPEHHANAAPHPSSHRRLSVVSAMDD